MFKMFSMEEKPSVGTIRGKVPYGLGPYTDSEGNKWDVGAYGKDSEGWWVSAVPARNLHPYYSDTSTARYSTVFQTWEPYRLEIVSET